MKTSHIELMRLALTLAASSPPGEVPIAAVIIDRNGGIASSSNNEVLKRLESTAHAELLAISSVDLETLKRFGKDMTMVVTLEPCPMCAWALRSSGLGKLIFGAYNPLYGAAGSVYDLLRDKPHGRRVEVVGGVLEEECKRILDDAFLDMRNNGGR